MKKKPTKKHVKPSRPSGGGWVRSGIVFHNGGQCEWWVNHSSETMKEKFVLIT